MKEILETLDEMDRNINLKFTFITNTSFKKKTLSFVGSLILATESTQLLTTHFTDQEIALILKYETKRVERMLHYNLEVWVQDISWVER